MKSILRSVSVALLASIVTIVFFSPRLPVFTAEAPGSYEWTRGLNFLDQVNGQAIEKVEPALRHRLLPVYAARLFGLNGYSVFVLGWIGVICLLAYVYTLSEELGLARGLAVAATFLFASTSAVITSLGWLGIFDCWWVLALVMTALAPQMWLVAGASLLAPWIDERFLIGLPVALMARWLVYPFRLRAGARLAALVAVAIAPYLVWRTYSLLHMPGDVSGDFLSYHFLVWLRMVPHGWWMAYRLAWVFLLTPFFMPNVSGVKPWVMALCCLTVAFSAVVTAADITRSAMVLAPWMLAGITVAWRSYPKETALWLPWVAAANFVVPYIHVVYINLEPVHPLPWEIIRLLKKLTS